MKHLPWVVGPVERLMREQGCEAIYATGGPFSALVLGAWLSKRSGLPLILDLRDPWSIEPNYQADRSALGQAIINRVELWCFKRASKVILNTSSACDAYRKRYAHTLPSSHFCFIRNTFDPELYTSPPPPPGAEGPFKIAYFGHLRPTKNALLFLEAYRAWLNKHNLTPQDSELLMLGEISDADRTQLNALNLTPHLSSAQPVPFTRAPEVLGHVDLLLDLMGPNHHMQIGGKLYDYLACNRPILSISPNIELDALFSATQAGERVALSTKAIIGALDRAYNAKREGRPFTPNAEAVYELSAVPLTTQLAEILSFL
jgi:glycosyltransferase involved in cell wall biosynthesis